MRIIPQAAWIWSRPERALAFGFGSGLSLLAPGTVGTLYAWAIYLGFYAFLESTTISWIIGIGAVAGIWICGKVGEELGVPDHGGIVWDEFSGLWITFIFAPKHWMVALVGFALFRFFDIVKPPPIRAVERRFKGGFGVMIDDILAAGYTLLLLAVAWRILG